MCTLHSHSPTSLRPASPCSPQVQGEHWNHKSCSLHIKIACVLNEDTWNAAIDEQEALKDHTQVTVDGEMAGQPVAVKSFWAEVVGHTEAPGGHGYLYNVQDEHGNVYYNVERKRLRVREWYTWCMTGISDDNSHDSYAMQHYVKRTLDWMEKNGVVKDRGLCALHVHSDNAGEWGAWSRVCLCTPHSTLCTALHPLLAGQHYKSNKSIYWLTTLINEALTGRPWIRSAAWSFGTPGHGKGPWDGMSGTFKRYIRNISQQRHTQNVDPKDIIRTESGNIRTAKEMYEQLRYKFGGKKTEKMNEYVFLYVECNEIERPSRTIEHDPIEDLKRHFSFFAMRPGVVLKRELSCWCTACVAAFMEGPAKREHLRRHFKWRMPNEKEDSYIYSVVHCDKNDTTNSSIYAWDAHRTACRPKKGSNLDNRDEEVCQHGLKLAKELKVNDLCLIESSKYPMELWLAEVVAEPKQFSRSSGSRKRLKGCVERVKVGSTNVDFWPGDVKLEVKIYERVWSEEYSEQLEFYRDDTFDSVLPIHGREVRGKVVDYATDMAVLATGAEAVERVTLDRAEEARALAWCR